MPKITKKQQKIERALISHNPTGKRTREHKAKLMETVNFFITFLKRENEINPFLIRSKKQQKIILIYIYFL